MSRLRQINGDLMHVADLLAPWRDLPDLCAVPGCHEEIGIDPFGGLCDAHYADELAAVARCDQRHADRLLMVAAMEELQERLDDLPADRRGASGARA